MRTFSFVLAAAVLLAVGYMLIFGLPAGEPRDTNTPDTPTAAYFEDRMVALGVEDIGQPIEGFDANLLMMAFAGLAADDFRGVQTFEGHYEVRDGEVEYVRDQAQPVTSAEQTISSEGYATLLANVSARLGIAATDEQAIDAIVAQLNTSERIETRIDQGASALGVTVVPLELLEDNRCPVDAQCIQAGTVRVRALLESGLGEADQEFELNQPITTEAEIITLIQVFPIPSTEETPEPSDYRFVFEIAKR